MVFCWRTMIYYSSMIGILLTSYLRGGYWLANGNPPPPVNRAKFFLRNKGPGTVRDHWENREGWEPRQPHFHSVLEDSRKEETEFPNRSSHCASREPCLKPWRGAGYPSVLNRGMNFLFCFKLCFKIMEQDKQAESLDTSELPFSPPKTVVECFLTSVWPNPSGD